MEKYASSYKTPPIVKQIIDSDKIPVMPYKRPMTKKVFFKKCEYIYNEESDTFTCPNNCPIKNKCTESKNNTKILTLHVFHKYIEKTEEYRLPCKNIYKQRSQTIERVFTDEKENNNLRYTRLRGIEKVTDELTFKFLCMNIKKYATWKAKKDDRGKISSTFHSKSLDSCIIFRFIENYYHFV